MVTATIEATTPGTEVFAWVYPVPGVAPEQAGAELQTIYDRQGVVTPEAVVEAARPIDAPLHPAFTWDDSEAAELYREDQARSLMRKLTVSYRQPDGSLTPAGRYVVKLTARADEDVEDDVLQVATAPHVYIPVRKVMDEEILRRKYVREAYLSMVSWSRRYRDIDEFARVHEAIAALGVDFGKAP